jgi:exopolysaccharide biosynthesis WecB/TagA/CpsF family protein
VTVVLVDGWAAGLRQVEILGVPLMSGMPAPAAEAIERASLSDEGPVMVAFANAHTLNMAARRPDYREVLRDRFVVLNDGIGVSLAARLYGVRLPANLNGSDFTPILLRRAAARSWPVYLLGARPQVAADAAKELETQIPGLNVVGTHDGYFPRERSPDIVEEIRSTSAQVILVAMGNPEQELWLVDHLAETGARLGIGVGAFLDFTVGTVPRAPRWMNTYGIEWVYRLFREPARMWRRYVLGNPAFLCRAAWNRIWRSSKRPL